MKIDANCEVLCNRTNMCWFDIMVPVDADYVEADADAIREWVANSKEIESLCKDNDISTSEVKISILNLDELIEELTYDEFAAATNLDNPKWS